MRIEKKNNGETDSLLSELSKLKRELPNKYLYDEDTVLAKYIDLASRSSEGVGDYAIKLYYKCYNTKEKEGYKDLFRALTGIQFDDYLKECIHTIQFEIDNPFEKRLADAGLSGTEIEEVFDVCQKPELVRIYNSVNAVGAACKKDVEKQVFVSNNDLGELIVKSNPNIFIPLSTGRVVEYKRIQ